MSTISANGELEPPDEPPEPPPEDEDEDPLAPPRLPAVALAPELPVPPLEELPEDEVLPDALEFDPAETVSPGERFASETIVPLAGAYSLVFASAVWAFWTLACAAYTEACADAMLAGEGVVVVLVLVVVVARVVEPPPAPPPAPAPLGRLEELCGVLPLEEDLAPLLGELPDGLLGLALFGVEVVVVELVVVVVDDDDDEVVVECGRPDPGLYAANSVLLEPGTKTAAVAPVLAVDPLPLAALELDPAAPAPPAPALEVAVPFSIAVSWS